MKTADLSRRCPSISVTDSARFLVLAKIRPTLVLITLAATTGSDAQKGALSQPRLSQPRVEVSSTPLTVALVWAPVDYAESYTAEVSSSPTGPWTPLQMRPLDTKVTAPTFNTSNNPGGTLYYYRVTAAWRDGEPGVTVVPRVTPSIINPPGLHVRQDGADLLVSWAPVPHASSYLVTAALGQLLPPTHSLEVRAQSAEARLPNFVLGAPADIWVTVKARYAPTGALSSGVTSKALYWPAQMCWPQVAPAGQHPPVAVSGVGPTSVMLSVNTVEKVVSLGRVRAVRTPAASQAWTSTGCVAAREIVDVNLTPGMQYQYRVTEITPTGTVGETTIDVTTPQAPLNPTPTATIGPCANFPVCVKLDWPRVTGADNYRVQSSYGADLFTDPSGNSRPSNTVTIGPVPSGVHAFSVTALFPLSRPGPHEPGQVTVVVP
jgi:hypothetical protein